MEEMLKSGNQRECFLSVLPWMKIFCYFSHSSQHLLRATCPKPWFEKFACSFDAAVLRYQKIWKMQWWRTVAAYTADREKELTAESPFQIWYVTNFHAGAAQGKRMCVVVCDAGTRYVQRVSGLFAWHKGRKIGWYRGNIFVPGFIVLGLFYAQRTRLIDNCETSS